MNQSIIQEGGAAGHMLHPYDINEYKLRDIKGLIRKLFEGKIEATEKIDGFAIQATKDLNGDTKFIRNKSDLKTGGMSVEDMKLKWKDNSYVLNTFLSAAKIISDVFDKVSNNFFNPNENTKVILNCECVNANKTNILYYEKACVLFHNIWIYKYEASKDCWIVYDITHHNLDKIESVCNKYDIPAFLTPKISIQQFNKSQELLLKYIKEIDKEFKNFGLGEYSDLRDYKYAVFLNYVKKMYKSLKNSQEILSILFNRVILSDKSTNIKNLLNMADDESQKQAIRQIDKEDYKKINKVCLEFLDNFFSRIGNDIISLCQGLISSKDKSKLQSDLQSVISDIKNSGNVELNSKLDFELNRLNQLGNIINSSEGIVFEYKGKLQKLTGSFAALNQIMGIRFLMN